MAEKTRKGFSADLLYTEIGIKHVMGVLFWDRNEKTLNSIIPDPGLRKQKRYPGALLIELAEKWNAVKKSDLLLKADLAGQGLIRINTDELVDYMLAKVASIKRQKVVMRYIDIFSLLCNLSPATRYEIKGNSVEFYEYEEDYTE